MDEELVEKVAEAIWNDDSIRATGEPRCVPWSEAGPLNTFIARHQARAAIQAMMDAGYVNPSVINIPSGEPIASYGTMTITAYGGEFGEDGTVIYTNKEPR